VQRLKSFFKFFILGLFLLIALAGGVYSLAWHFVSKNMQAHIDQFWTSLSEQEHLLIIGEKPVVSGFPYPPQFSFSGVVTADVNYLGGKVAAPLVFEIPEIVFVGFPLTGLTVYAEAPQGMGIVDQESGRGIRMDYALLNVTLPLEVPERLIYSDLKQWQDQENYFTINHIFFQIGDVKIMGNGVLGLNSELQPDLRIESKVVGMDALFDTLAENGAAQKKDLAIAKTFLSMVASVDPQTGEKFFETGFFIQNNNIFIGPMRIGEVPRTRWVGDPANSEEIKRSISRQNLRPE